jgi:TP901 family phage tail tape measure protein
MDLETLVVSFGADLSMLSRGVAGAKALLSGFGLAALGVGAASVKMAGDFQASMTALVTGAGESQKNIGMVSQGILNLATQTGTSTKQLADGMYMIESAGYHGATALSVLQAAAEGAKVGNADLGVVADGVTTIMTDYANKNVTAAQATNDLVATVANGKTHMQDLASAMATVLPTASAVGVGLYDVSGAMATMTGEGVPAADAATYLRQMLMALESPAKNAQTVLKEIGLSSSDVANEMKKSLPATLQMIIDHLSKKFPPGSAQFVSALKDIAGGSKQMQGMLDLTGSHLQVFGQNVATISQAVKGGGSSITGWSKVQGDFNFKLDQAKAAVETLMIKVGTALLPVLGKLFDNVGPLISKFGDWITKSGILQNVSNALGTAIDALPGIINNVSSALQSVNQLYQQNHDIINTVAVTISLLFVPALINSGVQAVIAGTKTAATFVVNVAKAGLAGWEAAGKLVVWIGQLIASGTQAVIAGAKITASFIASVAKAAAQAVTSGAVIAAQFISKLVMAGVQAAITAGQFLASLIPAIVSMTASAITAAATAIPGLIVGFIGWAGAAASAAIATIAATWPILLVVAGIAALIAIIVLLVTHWKQVTDFAITVWGHVKQFFQDDVVKPIGSLFNELGTNVHTILSNIGAFFSNLGSTVHTVIKGIGDAFSGLGKLVHGIWDGITGAIKGAINFVIGLINNVIGAIDNIHVNTPFGSIGFSIPKIPLLAAGGTVPPGGIAIAGETGKPELVLGGTSGATVLGVNQTAALMAHGSGQAPVIHNHIYIDGREMAQSMMIQVLSEIRGGGHPLGEVA